jgi:predicted SAM-dependent methyltransferase
VATAQSASAQARERLLDYLARFERDRATSFGPAPGDSAARRAAKLLFPAPLRMKPRLAATAALRPREERKLAALPSTGPLRLHLGCGNGPKDGWVNVDLAGYPVDVAWNLAHPLPLPEGSADAVFHEHLLEHLTLQDGLALAEESHRLLRPGGVLRIGVPDAGEGIKSYAEDPGGFLERVRPGSPTPLLALQAIFYYPGHQTMYDFETLELLLRAAGFESPERRAFGESRLEPVPDSEHRRDETLYVEAVR